MKQAQFDFDPTSPKRAHAEITSTALRHLQEHALGEFPREAVGCLLGSWDSCTVRILRACSVANNHPSPETNFEVSPESVLWAESEA
ncbi:MAG: hypothetical protein QXI19_02435, partial [Candidatus Caldarchaeum sp.]